MDGGSQVGYNPWGHKELDTAEQLHFYLYLSVLFAFPYFYNFKYLLKNK